MHSGPSPDVLELWSRIVNAPSCEATWTWNPAANIAKLTVQFSDGLERRFVLQPDRIIEIGPAPDKACRMLAGDEVVHALWGP